MEAISAGGAREPGGEMPLFGMPAPGRGQPSSSSPAGHRRGALARIPLAELRAHRQELLRDEQRIAYWLIVLGARRDLMRIGPGRHDPARLGRSLASSRDGSGASVRDLALCAHPDGPMALLPELAELWLTPIDSGDDADQARLMTSLTAAEGVLATYQTALQRSLRRATTELVSRYRDDPRACLVALSEAR